MKRRQFLKDTGRGVGALALAPLFEDAAHSRDVSSPADRNRAEYAFIRRRGDRWTLGTESVERVVTLEGGRFLLKSLKDRAAGQELAPSGPIEEFFLTTGDGRRISSAEGIWTLIRTRKTRLKQGERQLELTLRQGPVEVTKSYVVYPGSSVIREWVTLTNAGSDGLIVVEPGIFSLRVQPGGPSDFHWMTGGENQPDMWLLKTEQLEPGRPRVFDSYDPFPTDRPMFPGDGINAGILLNETPIWPSHGWQYAANALVTIPFDIKTEVSPGDRLVFVVNMNQNISFDTTGFNPTIRYEDGETHVASQEFSGQQGRGGWRYGYLENGRFVELVYYPAHGQWRKARDNATGTPFVGPDSEHPDVGQDAARVWTAPRAGHIRITGTVCNTGNQAATGPFGFRMGSSSYAPWVAFQRRDDGGGVFIGWDYFGHWASSYESDRNGAITARMRVAGHRQSLAPGESLSSPRAFVGLFQSDLDEAGNELLDWRRAASYSYRRV